MPMHGVRGKAWPVSCGFSATGGSTDASGPLLRVHAQGMRTHCTDQRDLDGDRARSAPRGAAVGSRRALWACVRRSRCRSKQVTLRSRAIVRAWRSVPHGYGTTCGGAPAM